MINERYLIKKKLGQGRSAVYLCSDTEFPDKDQAIKILPPEASQEEIQSFNNEYFNLRKLNHPNIIKSNELGTIVKKNDADKEISVGSRFLTLEFFRGAELLKYGKLKDEKVLLEIIKQLCSVLYYLHQSNYIYYDLKTENILINENNNKPEIKLIDLGFAQYLPDIEIDSLRGTAEYIAPELLRNEDHDHRVDLYSLGILLYRILYDTFPFKTKNEIDIYKSHLEEEFIFPASIYSEKLINAIKKLLAKNPSDRFANSLEILAALEIKIDDDIIKDFIPALTFSGRNDILTIINTYLADKQSGEVFVIKGSEGAGKTTLINEIYYKNYNVVSITDNKLKSGAEFIRLIMKRIIYSGFVYPDLSQDDIQRSENLINEIPVNLIDELKSLIGSITQKCSFILLLDGFNFYDDFTLEVLANIFPILQVNGIKIILCENSDTNDKANVINNIREINLNQFTEAQLTEFIERSYYPAFPAEELRKIILQHADLLPGNIMGFIKDLLILEIIEFGPEGVKIKSGKKTDLLLRSSHEEIYKLRINTLTPEELNLAKLISSFESTIDIKSISLLVDTNINKTMEILVGLQNKNIIQQLTLTSNPVFTTESLKQFVYSKIQNKKEYHGELVKAIKEKLSGFNIIELSRQYELAEEFYESYLIIHDEVTKAERISAYSYQVKLLNHLLEVFLPENIILEIKYILCKALIKLNDYKSAIDLIKKLENNIIDKDKLIDLVVLKGGCLIGLGEYEEGKEHLASLIPELKDKRLKQQLLVEIVKANVELNKYAEASDLCEEIIGNEDSSAVEKGKCYNYLGLMQIYNNNNMEKALGYFEKAEKIYEKYDLKLSIAQMEMNMGNIYNMIGNHKLAEDYWNKSLNLNKSLGNLAQESKILVNFGVFNFYISNFEKSIEFYKRAYSIFMSLGNKIEQANVLGNMGDIYFITCEYQNAITHLSESKNIYESIQNYNECLESFSLLCKTYLILGDYKTYERMLKEFEKLVAIESVNTKHRMNLEFMKILILNDEKELKNSLNRLEDIKNEYFNNEEKYNYFYCSSFKIKILIRLNEFPKALDELNSEELITVCKENSYFEAERLYLLGLLSASANEPELKPSIDYYLNAYDIIKDLDITELTWKVLFVLAVIYAERGNLSRAADYLVYVKSVLDYIDEKITDERLKMVYFDQPDRQYALETLKRIAEQM